MLRAVLMVAVDNVQLAVDSKTNIDRAKPLQIRTFLLVRSMRSVFCGILLYL